MANFSSEESLKVPISDMKKRLVMEKRETVNIMMTRFYEDGELSTDELFKVRASLISLFMELGEHIRTFYGEEKWEEIRKDVFSKGYIDKLEKAYQSMDRIISEVVEANKEALL